MSTAFFDKYIEQLELQVITAHLNFYRNYPRKPIDRREAASVG
jgi:hypothetical protein